MNRSYHGGMDLRKTSPNGAETGHLCSAAFIQQKRLHSSHLHRASQMTHAAGKFFIGGNWKCNGEASPKSLHGESLYFIFIQRQPQFSCSTEGIRGTFGCICNCQLYMATCISQRGASSPLQRGSRGLCDSVGTVDSIKELVGDLNNGPIPNDVEVVIAPNFIHLWQVLNNIRPEITVAAQNCWSTNMGAYTGEVCVLSFSPGPPSVLLQ